MKAVRTLIGPDHDLKLWSGMLVFICGCVLSACSKKKLEGGASAAPTQQATVSSLPRISGVPLEKSAVETAKPKQEPAAAEPVVPVRQTPALREEARRKAMQEMTELRKNSAQ